MLASSWLNKRARGPRGHGCQGPLYLRPAPPGLLPVHAGSCGEGGVYSTTASLFSQWLCLVVAPAVSLSPRPPGSGVSGASVGTLGWIPRKGVLGGSWDVASPCALDSEGS